jgi:hypothetical protein
MRWRVLLLVLSCVLLPLPLVGLVFMTMQRPQVPTSLETKTHLVPMLPMDALRALPTYGRLCNADANCDPELGCLLIESELRSECTDSRCMEDKDCPEGFSCLALKTRSGKAMVRRCSLIGDRKEGEACELLARSLRLGCARGLFCQAGWCGRPCQPDDPSNCPSGFLCSDGRDGPPSCIPTCKGRSCPEGQQCTPDEGGASFCMQVHGPDCRVTRCPEKHVCRLMSPPQRPWEMRTECRRRCDATKPCPEGTVCLDYECRQTCDPQAPSTCGPGLICGQYKPSDPWYCLPG